MLPGGGHCTNTRFTGLFNQSWVSKYPRFRVLKFIVTAVGTANKYFVYLHVPPGVDANSTRASYFPWSFSWFSTRKLRSRSPAHSPLPCRRAPSASHRPLLHVPSRLRRLTLLCPAVALLLSGPMYCPTFAASLSFALPPRYFSASASHLLRLPCRTWPEPAQGLQTAFPATLLKRLPFRRTKVFASWPFMNIRNGCRFAVARAGCPFNALECWFFTRSRIAPRRSRLTYRGVDFLKSAESIFDLLFHTESIFTLL